MRQTLFPRNAPGEQTADFDFDLLLKNVKNGRLLWMEAARQLTRARVDR